MAAKGARPRNAMNVEDRHAFPFGTSKQTNVVANCVTRLHERAVNVSLPDVDDPVRPRLRVADFSGKIKSGACGTVRKRSTRPLVMLPVVGNVGIRQACSE